jgi:hypothetical protein
MTTFVKIAPRGGSCRSSGLLLTALGQTVWPLPSSEGGVRVFGVFLGGVRLGGSTCDGGLRQAARFSRFGLFCLRRRFEGDFRGLIGFFAFCSGVLAGNSPPSLYPLRFTPNTRTVLFEHFRIGQDLPLFGKRVAEGDTGRQPFLGFIVDQEAARDSPLNAGAGCALLKMQLLGQAVSETSGRPIAATASTVSRTVGGTVASMPSAKSLPTKL